MPVSQKPEPERKPPQSTPWVWAPVASLPRAVLEEPLPRQVCSPSPVPTDSKQNPHAGCCSLCLEVSEVVIGQEG